MEQQQRYTLGRNNKLKSEKAIEQLFKEGKSFAVSPLRVLYLYPEAPVCGKELEAGASRYRIAFSVSKKYFKKAVDRNRVKRLLREAWRLQQNELVNKIKDTKKTLAIFIIYTGNELPAYELMYKKMAAAIKKLVKACDEATVTNT